MSEYYLKGQGIPLVNGEQAIIAEKLGEGSQGIVYRVKIGKRDYALKWYHKGCLREPDIFYYNLADNIKSGAPSDSFLWPLYLTKRFGGSFGYITEMRPKNYHELSEFLLAGVRFSSLSAVVSAALNITNCFRALHQRGCAYYDLDDGCFLIEPDTGDVLICNNDSIAPFGKNLGVSGKARYMAPEIVRSANLPDDLTDDFSLAVILYRLLFLDHPLEGNRFIAASCLTEDLELTFYGKDPIFVYDPIDDSNRPVDGFHQNEMRLWKMYPDFVRKKFTTAFSKDAMLGNAKRPTDTDWQLTFSRMRDCIVRCQCGEETFLDLRGDSNCLNCGMTIPKPPMLNCHNRKYVVPLFPGSKIYRLHVDNDTDDYNEIIGEVVRNPKKPNIWGLRNLSHLAWNVETKSGEVKSVEPGKSAPVVQIKSVRFPTGTVTAE